MPVVIASQHKPRSGTDQPDLTLASLLDDLESYFSDAHANWIDPDYPLLIGLWSVHTHFIRVYEFRANHTPYLNVKSRDPNAGKSALSHALARVVPGDGCTRSSTIAQIKRFLISGENNRVLILEQFHNFGKARSNADREQLHELLCNGFEPGTLKDETLANGQTVKYDMYYPKAFFGLTSFHLDSEAQLRCIDVIVRQSTKQQEIELWERYDRNPLPEHGAKIKATIESWVTPERAKTLNDIMVRNGKVLALNPGHGELLHRESDNWRMIFALADIAGSKYGKRIRNIAARMTVSHSTDETEIDISEAERFDRSIIDLARHGRLPVLNYLNKKQPPISDHPDTVIENQQLGWPRDTRYKKDILLDPVSLVCNDKTRKAELRIKVTDLPDLVDALGSSRSEFISAYRNAGRIRSQQRKDYSVDTTSSKMFNGDAKPSTILAINFDSVVFGKGK